MSTSRTVAHNKEQNQYRGSFNVGICLGPVDLGPVDDVKISSRDLDDGFAKTPFRKICMLCCEHKIEEQFPCPG